VLAAARGFFERETVGSNAGLRFAAGMKAARQSSGEVLPIATEWIGMSYGGVNVTTYPRYPRRRAAAAVTGG
jgi:hypothetical protein